MRGFQRRLRLLKVLRDAGTPAVLGLIVVLVVESSMPAASTAALAMLVGRIDEPASDDLVASAVLPLVLYGLALGVGHAATAVKDPLTSLVAARVDGRHRTTVSQVATAPQYVNQLERPEAQALLREAVVDRSRGYNCTPSDGALAQLRIATAMVGAAFVCLVLASFAWWMVALGLLPALVNRAVRNRQSHGIVDLWKAASVTEMHADVWRRASVSPGEGKDVRIFGFGPWMVDRMQERIRAANAPLWTYISRMLLQLWVPFLVIAICLVPAYVIVSLSAVQGETSAAVAVAVISGAWALLQILQPDFDHYQLNGSLRTLDALDELRDLLRSEPPRGEDTPAGVLDARPAGRDVPRVCLDHVSFHYPDSDRMVLDDLSLEITPGELLAIVGLNGAGKSTLIKLMSGLYAPTSGQVTVNGVALQRTNLETWRSQMSVVFQDFVRYDLSALDNVELGYCWLPADGTMIEEAARASGFAHRVARLPRGWETPLSRSRVGGTDLSGGQWQQLALTRALYALRRGAKVLVLDEPTAHLDVRTEFEVFRRLADLRGDASVILISHRLSTARDADRIVFLEDGRIAESGSHDQLIALGGRYAALFEIQAERFRRGYDDRFEERWSS